MSRIEDAILKIKARSQRDSERSSIAAAAVQRVPTPAPEHTATVVPTGPAHRPRPLPTKSIRLDLAHLRVEGLVPPLSDERRITNEFRAIKRALLANVTGRSGEAIPGASVIMVASALPNEGKTYTAFNLALSLSLEQDYHVVLVDGDVAKPNITRVLDLERERGLLDALEDPELHLDDVEVATDLPSLTIIPAGTPRDSANEMLSSTRMETLVKEAAERPGYLYVFDSTPLLLTNESRALAEFVGQIALVVRAGVTPQQAVKSAIDALPKDRFIGLVLNQRKGTVDERYYGYGYGYQYGAGKA
jgi:exopolysaccharide/PEP-CTERM locus tyrosine autokinase